MLTNSSPNPRDAPWTNATPGAVACCALPPSTDAAVRITPVWKKLAHKLLRDTISDDVLRRNARKKQALTHLEHTTAAIAIAIASAPPCLYVHLSSQELSSVSLPDESRMKQRDGTPFQRTTLFIPFCLHSWSMQSFSGFFFFSFNFVFCTPSLRISVVGTSCWHPIKCYKKIRLEPRKRNCSLLKFYRLQQQSLRRLLMFMQPLPRMQWWIIWLSWLSNCERKWI
jgi:hypothetical protein